MMKDLIICHYQMFDKEQNIFILKDGLPSKYHFDTEICGQAMAEFAMAQNINEIDLYGNAEALQHIKQAIQERELVEYSENKIIINIKETEDDLDD